MIVQLGVIITVIIVFIALLIFLYYEENFENDEKNKASQTLDLIQQSFQETKNHYLNAKRLYVSGQVPLIEITNTEAAAIDTQTHFNTLQTQTVEASMLQQGNRYVIEAMKLAEKAKSNFTYINN